MGRILGHEYILYSYMDPLGWLSGTSSLKYEHYYLLFCFVLLGIIPTSHYTFFLNVVLLDCLKVRPRRVPVGWLSGECPTESLRKPYIAPLPLHERCPRICV